MRNVHRFPVQTYFERSSAVEQRITTATLPHHPDTLSEPFPTSTESRPLSALEIELLGTSPNPMYNTTFTIPSGAPGPQEEHSSHNPGDQIPPQPLNNGHLAIEHLPPGMFSVQDGVVPTSSTINEELSSHAEIPDPASPHTLSSASEGRAPSSGPQRSDTRNLEVILSHYVDEMYPVMTEERYNTDRQWKCPFRGCASILTDSETAVGSHFAAAHPHPSQSTQSRETWRASTEDSRPNFNITSPPPLLSLSAAASQADSKRVASLLMASELVKLDFRVGVTHRVA
ncbi:hypothetical protein DENSPDRAFT_885781 [Dentipellis sp. KUC8613]|nr:hypothetical protein DENSPDRAFT_885781 [Dentipellis sp. KUC8613]